MYNQDMKVTVKQDNPAKIYLFRAKNRNTKKFYLFDLYLFSNKKVKFTKANYNYDI